MRRENRATKEFKQRNINGKRQQERLEQRCQEDRRKRLLSQIADDLDQEED